MLILLRGTIRQSVDANSRLCRCCSTIFAPSSGRGKCGVCVVRVSGKSSSLALKTIIRSERLPHPRMATLKKLFDPKSGILLDHALTLWFPGPASFTGEDTCELHLHGGPAVVRSVLDALSSIRGLRPAEPGEFTRRAFQAGKLDLTQVEGLSDLIHAESEQQRRLALRQMDGYLHKYFQGWSQKLLKIVANVEAYIDFHESEDIEDDILDSVRFEVEALIQELHHHLDRARVGERIRSGVQLAIVGEPNVGKSSLLNFLLQRPAAIVSPTAGTTRDVLETQLEIGGFAVNLCDTAGLRFESNDPIEQEGISRALHAAKTADLLIHVTDASRYNATKTLQNKFGIKCDKKISVVNKIDLVDKVVTTEDDNSVYVSLKTGAGLDDFLRRLEKEVEDLCQLDQECPVLTRDRHRTHLKRACQYLESYLSLETSSDIVICAHQLRKAVREIGSITGKVSSDKILDVIFADFCIGK